MNRRQTTTKVFVGSLPGGVTTDDLRRLFAPYGPIAECDIANRCGFLHLEDRELAYKAIEELNNTNFMGTRISVEKGRVKPPKSRRGDIGGGPMMMKGPGRDRPGPYSRDGYGRGPPPRNGGEYGGRYDMGYEEGGGRYDYDRGMPPAARGGYDGGRYDDIGERRNPYDDRGGYMDRRSYNGYGDRAPYPDVPRGGYDTDGSIPGSGPTGYDDRRAAPAAGYDRGASGSDIYSRRDTPKPLIQSAGGYGDRSSGAGYGSSAGDPAAYGSPAAASVGVNQAAAAAAAATYPAAVVYAGSTVGYGAASAPTYPDARGPAAATGYAAGGYGDGYASSGGGRSGGYDTAYPPLPQQRAGYGNSSGPGTGPRRDMPPGRRY